MLSHRPMTPWGPTAKLAAILHLGIPDLTACHLCMLNWDTPESYFSQAPRSASCIHDKPAPITHPAIRAGSFARHDGVSFHRPSLHGCCYPSTNTTSTRRVLRETRRDNDPRPARPATDGRAFSIHLPKTHSGSSRPGDSHVGRAPYSTFNAIGCPLEALSQCSGLLMKIQATASLRDTVKLMILER